MRVCVFGSGAIGAWVGALLHRAGAAEVTLIARGAHLEAMRCNGVRILTEEGEITAKPFCTDRAHEVDSPDYLIIAVKAHSVTPALESIRPLVAENTAVVTMTNGIPYWYFYKHGGPWENSILQSVDPGGRQWETLGPERAIGCVVYPAAEVTAPGVIQHVYGNKFPIGEPSEQRTDRLNALSEAMNEAGLDSPMREHIRDEIWLKLWGNLCFNPISALTHATLDVITSDPGTRGVARAMMEEAQAIGDRLGVHFRVDIERRINGAGAVGAHKTSMLQDLERARPLEIDPLVTVVQEMGRLVGVPTPTIDVVLALVRQRAAVAGLYAGS